MFKYIKIVFSSRILWGALIGLLFSFVGVVVCNEFSFGDDFIKFFVFLFFGFSLFSITAVQISGRGVVREKLLALVSLFLSFGIVFYGVYFDNENSLLFTIAAVLYVSLMDVLIRHLKRKERRVV